MKRCGPSAPSPTRVATAAVVLTLALVGQVSADYRDHFREGVKAYDEQRWADSVAAMNRALAERPHADNYKVTVFSSLRIAYVPNTFLAIALAKLGRCDEAVPAMERAEAQGVAARSARKYYREALEEANGCRQKLMQSNISQVQQLMAEVSAIADQVEESAADGTGARVLAENSSLTSRIDQAKQLQRAATERLSLGVQGNSLVTVGEAADLAERARTEWATVRRDLNIRIASAAPVDPGPPTVDSSDAQRALDGARRAREGVAQRLRAGGGDAPMRRNPGVRARWQESGRRLEQLQTTLDTAVANRDQATLDQVVEGAQRLTQAFTRLDQEIERLLRERSPQPRPPADTSSPSSGDAEENDPATGGAGTADRDEPSSNRGENRQSSDAEEAEAERRMPRTAEQRFVRAATRFFSGQYDAAAEDLDSFSFENQPELETQRRVLFAASMFSQSRQLAAGAEGLGEAEGAGERPERAQLLARAEVILRELLAEQPELEIDPRYFSPAFRGFADRLRNPASD